MAINIRMSKEGITAWDSECSASARLKFYPSGEGELWFKEHSNRRRIENTFQLDKPCMELSMKDIQEMVHDVNKQIANISTPRHRVVMSSQLGNDWSAEHHLKRYANIVPVGCTEITGAPCKTAT